MIISELKLTAGQRTMSSQKSDLTSQKLQMPVMLTGHIMLNSSDSVPLHWAAEPCQGYLLLSFKLFFVLGQILIGLHVATTGTNKLYLWV